MLQVGCILNTFIRRSDVVKIACIAQLVNVIAPIMTEPGGRPGRPIYYPYYFASIYGRGTALNVATDAPTYDCEVEHDVSFLDVAAVDNPYGMVTIFLLNRYSTEAMDLDMAVLGYDGLTLARHITIGGEGQNWRCDASTADQPDKVAPRDGKGLGLDGGRLVGALSPLSYHVVRLKKA